MLNQSSVSFSPRPRDLERDRLSVIVSVPASCGTLRSTRPEGKVDAMEIAASDSPCGI
jgi:hypothetical protein